MTRRELLLGSWFPFLGFFRRSISIGGQKFRILKRGDDWRHYIWIHGNEQTAREVLAEHMKHVYGRAFLVENDTRNIPLAGGKIDPNRMFSRVGAEKSLRKLNDGWGDDKIKAALDRLDHDRRQFVEAIFPPGGSLLIALHNNSANYSVNDEVPLSDAVALNNKENPHEFLLCTAQSDFDILSGLTHNVVLQNKPKEDDGSLSRLAAANGVRYINIEARMGNAAGQKLMLEAVERSLT